MNKETQNELFLVIKEHIINFSATYIPSYAFETFNNLNIYTKPKQIEVLNEMIIELNDIINDRHGWSYLENGVFNSDYFFKNNLEFNLELGFEQSEYQEILRLDVQNKLDDIIKDYLLETENIPFFVKFYNDLKKDYIDCKILELLLLKRNELTTDNSEKSDIDLSDTKATEKIVMLHKLGVLDFLRNKEPFNLSINSLATALSGITGIDSKTIQSYINPIYSNRTNQKNNPLNSIKTVDKVDQKLISIGFKPFK
jgi:hypothetical protein